MVPEQSGIFFEKKAFFFNSHFFCHKFFIYLLNQLNINSKKGVTSGVTKLKKGVKSRILLQICHKPLQICHTCHK